MERSNFSVYDEVAKLFRQQTILSASTACLFLLSLIFYKYIHVWLIPWSFLLGVVSCYVIFSQTRVLPNLLPMFDRKRKEGVRKILEAEVSGSCPVCGDKQCYRHNFVPDFFDVGNKFLNIDELLREYCLLRSGQEPKGQQNPKNNQPWMDVFIPERVDKALTNLFDYVLKDYVYTLWYKDLSTDEDFVTELRMLIRHVMAVLLKRTQQVDIPSLILDKLVKASLTHVDVYLRAKKKLKPREDIQSATIREYGPYLHVAARNRTTELEYLNHLCELVLPHVLPQKHLNSKCSRVFIRDLITGRVFLPAIDVIANPDVINHLLYLFFDPESMVPSTDPPSPQVSILQSFCEAKLPPRKSALHFEADDVLFNRDLLFPNLQFMKREGVLNILQFCLTVEDFNRRSLNPELTTEQKKRLHKEAQELYRIYFAPDAVDKISFDQDIVDEVKDIAEGDFEQVSRLRTSSALFRAYEYTFRLMENTFCPMFHHSDEFFVIHCGARPVPVTKSSSSSSEDEDFHCPSQEGQPPSFLSLRMSFRRPDTLAAMHRIGSKLRGVFRGQTLDEDSIFQFGFLDQETAPSMPDSDSLQEMEERRGVSSPQHDLSAWRVSIPKVELRQEAGRDFFVYVIKVKRIDVDTDSGEIVEWMVERRFNEFYVLDAKLNEFHGGFDFEDVQLPGRRSFTAKTFDFMENKRPVFEKYLQTLLTKPILRGSQLLYSFLTKNEEFVSKLLPDVNLGKIMKTVSTKVIKERGQHLEPFLQSFLASVEEPKPRPGGDEVDIDDQKFIKEVVNDPVFGNNADIPLDRKKLFIPGKRQNVKFLELNGVFDYILYLARSVFEIPDGLHHILILIGKIFKNTLETFLDYYLGYKMDLVASEVEMEKLINLLTEVLFIDDDPPRTDFQKQQRKEEAFEQVISFFPSVLSKVLGEESYVGGFKLLFDGLQCPKLNKHLSYVLLDIAVQELFPELADAKLTGLSTFQEDHY